MKTTPYVYQDKPLFGFDIGYSSMKVMQLGWLNKKPHIVGYGVHSFDNGIVKDGVIIDPESLAKSAVDMFKNHVVGDITTKRVALGIPASKTYSRIIKLPRLAKSDLADAVKTEAEQYIPVPIDQLYMDYDITRSTEKELELFSVAVPRKIVDSYEIFARLLGLESVAMETTIGASARIFLRSKSSDIPSVLIDFGSISSDISVFDKSLIVTGTVNIGGDNFTAKISEILNVSIAEAEIIKSKYGLSFSKKQREISSALSPYLAQLLKEIRRMIRYYEERFGNKQKIQQVVTMGGGANMPGLSEFLTDSLRIPVTMSDPWQHIGKGRLQPPSVSERSIYTTVSGLAMINPREAFS